MNNAVRNSCSYLGVSDDALRSTLITIVSWHNSGFSQADAIVTSTASCSQMECVNCWTTMIDRVYCPGLFSCQP